jgi:HPt (histidine-containing phosphotransfer) domain-containing protein
MTANAMKDDREKCLQVGMNDHISKPIDVNLLFNVLDKWLGLASDVIEQTTENNEAAIELQFPKHLPGIDIVSALSRLTNNKSLFKRVVCGFYQDHQQIIEDLKSAVKDNDWLKVQEYVHQIKGSAGNISALELAKLAKLIERKIKQSDYQEIPQQVQKLEQAFLEIGLTVQVLNSWNNIELETIEENTQQKNETNYKLLQWQLAQLKILLLSHDLQAESLFNNIFLPLSAIVDKKIMQVIQLNITNLDYEQAQQTIDLHIIPALTKLKQ